MCVCVCIDLSQKNIFVVATNMLNFTFLCNIILKDYHYSWVSHISLTLVGMRFDLEMQWMIPRVCDCYERLMIQNVGCEEILFVYLPRTNFSWMCSCVV